MFGLNCAAMLDTVPIPSTRANGPSANTIIGTSDATVDSDGVSRIPTNRASGAQEPTLFHKVKNKKSILALVVSDSYIYAGTQDGELKVRYRFRERSV